MLQYSCPRCHASLQASPIDAGTRRECTACGKPVKVPGVPFGASAEASIDDDLSLWPEEKKPTPAAAEKPTPSAAGNPVPSEAEKPVNEQDLWPPNKASNQPTPTSSGDSLLGDESLPSPSKPQELPPPPTMLTPGHVIMDPSAAVSSDGSEELTIRSESRRPGKQRSGKQRRYITVVCGVCETRLHATEDKVGQKLTCPDCGNRETLVAAPVKKKTPPAPNKDPNKAPGKTPPKNRPSSSQTTGPGESKPFDLGEMVESWSSDIQKTPDKPAAESQGDSLPFDIPQAAPKYITMLCGLCETLLTFTEDRIGQEEHCPDCHSMVIVKQQKSLVKSGKLGPGMQPPPEEVGEEIQLHEGIDQPTQEINLAANEQFRITCPVCETHLFATLAKVGRKAVCPDCKSSFRIDPPKPKAASEKKQVVLDDGGIRVGKKVERTISPADQPASIGQETLEKAHKELEEEERVRPKLPPAPLITGVFFYPWSGHSVACWISVSLWMMISLACVVPMVNSLLAGGTTMLIAAALAVPSAVATFICAIYASICAATIVQESGNGVDNVDEWPGWNVLDWGFDAFYGVVAFIVSLVPGGVLALIASPLGLVSLLLPVFTVTLLFPVLLLSMLEESSLGGIVSPDMWRRLAKSPQNLLLFYLLSPLIILLAAASLAGAFFLGCIAVLPAALICAALGMIYFHMLGRLAWAAMEAEAEAELKKQRAAKPPEF